MVSTFCVCAVVNRNSLRRWTLLSNFYFDFCLEKKNFWSKNVVFVFRFAFFLLSLSSFQLYNLTTTAKYCKSNFLHRLRYLNFIGLPMYKHEQQQTKEFKRKRKKKATSKAHTSLLSSSFCCCCFLFCDNASSFFFFLSYVLVVVMIFDDDDDDDWWWSH